MQMQCSSTFLLSYFLLSLCNYPRNPSLHSTQFGFFLFQTLSAFALQVDVNVENLTRGNELGENGPSIHFNGSPTPCSDDNLNSNCGRNGSQTQAQGHTPTGNEAEPGGLQSAVEWGVHLSSKECQSRFRWSRWNCSDRNWMINTGTKESAYVTASTAAAVTYSISKACARGDIPTCGCAPPTTIADSGGRGGSGATAKQQQQHDESTSTLPQGGYWKWGGCSADIDFAIKLARKSSLRNVKRPVGRKGKTGPPPPPKSVLQAVTTHNKRVGRNTIQKTLDTDCKCHGVSGSCTLKTCWIKLPPFRKIEGTVFTLYKRAQLVMDEETGGQTTPLQLWAGGEKPTRSQLVYLVPSPTYCDPDEKEHGHAGTKGRRCLRPAPSVSTDEHSAEEAEVESEGSCSLLCCGRGYNTHLTTRRWKCRCAFRWCCDVQCEDCEERVQVYTCN